MICIIALVVFGVLGIFSLSYREVAIEAFDCVFRRMTLRKCQTRLDERSRSQMTGKIKKLSPFLARYFYKYFRIIEFAFVLLFILSLIQTGISGYNYYLYGNCNGLEETGFCIFDPTGHNSQFSNIAQDSCGGEDNIFEIKDELSLDSINLSNFPIMNEGEDNVIFFIGCYDCQYTKETYPLIKELIEKENPTVYFAHLPVKNHMDLFTEYGNCIYKNEGSEAFAKFNDGMFGKDECSVDLCTEVISEIELDISEYDNCTKTNESVELFEKQLEELRTIGVYGTPTIFINDEVFVGPKPYRVYKRALK